MKNIFTISRYYYTIFADKVKGLSV